MTLKGRSTLARIPALSFSALSSNPHDTTGCVERFAHARSHGHMSGDVFINAGAFLNVLAPGISPDVFLMTVQQTVGVGNVMPALR